MKHTVIATFVAFVMSAFSATAQNPNGYYVSEPALLRYVENIKPVWALGIDALTGANISSSNRNMFGRQDGLNITATCSRAGYDILYVSYDFYERAGHVQYVVGEDPQSRIEYYAIASIYFSDRGNAGLGFGVEHTVAQFDYVKIMTFGQIEARTSQYGFHPVINFGLLIRSKFL